MGQGALLGVGHVLEQTAGRRDGQGQAGAPEAAQILGAELAGQVAFGAVRVEMPGRAAGQTPLQTQALGQGAILGEQDFRRPQPFQFAPQGRLAAQLLDGKATAAQVQAGQAVATGTGVQGQQQVVPALIQQSFVGDGAGRQDPGHPAFHWSLAGGRIPHLFANGHRYAQLDQSRQVGFRRMVGHARHGDGGAAGLAPFGEGDVQQAGGPLRVLVKEFVEVPHAIEQQQIRMLRLEAQVLAHDRRMALERVGGVAVHW